MSAADQLALFDLPPGPDPDYVLRVVKVPLPPRGTAFVDAQQSAIERNFWLFHEANPGVYVNLVYLARDLVSRGHTKLGIGMLFEVLRWQSMLRTTDPASDFKLNNNLRSRYSRLIAMNEPDLDGLFDVRELRS